MSPSQCLSNAELSDFLAGRLTDADIDRIAGHLETCHLCQEVVETLDAAGNTFLVQLAAAPPLSIPPACERAMGVVEQLLDAPSAAAESTLIGPAIRHIRDYRIIEKLGEGGMGAVFKAIHERLDRVVAIKVLPPDRVSDPQGISRFQREMKAIGRLQHANIVNAHDAGEADGIHFLVMEYVEGIDLATLVARLGPLSISDSCEIIRQAALGLQHIHQHGLVHRDIKPSNLMLSLTGQVKILDLGLALLHEPRQTAGLELTDPSQLMGTADYISPEQAENTHGVDIRADLYSLGCTFYKLLTGHAPFSGREFDSPLKKLIAHLQQMPPAVAAQRADVPPGLIAVLDRLLAKRPEDRYSTPGELVAALAPFSEQGGLRDLVARAIPGSPSVEAVQAASSRSDETTQTTRSAVCETDGGVKATPQTAPPKRWNKRRIQFAAMTAAGLLLVLGILILVRTPEGTIVLTMNQPEIAGAEVTVDRQKKLTIRTGIDNESIHVAADDQKHLLKISKGGFETFAQEFTVRGGKNPAIHVVLVPVGTDPIVSRVTGRPTAADKANEPGRPNERPITPAPAGDTKPSTGPQPAIAPFNAIQAQQHQETWAAYLKVPVESENSLGMKFRLIPPGEFAMGRSPRDDEVFSTEELSSSDLPRHNVTLTQPFAMGTTEVTQGQWKEVMGTSPWHNQEMATDDDALPATYVNWSGANNFCRRLSERDGQAYRLPTEAEWEFVCRAGTTTSFSFGDDVRDLPEFAWTRRNSHDLPHPVGTKQPNPWGLFDMHGNAWEWCDAHFSKYPSASVVDPQSEGTDRYRPLRGGCFWSVPAGDYRSSVRRRWPEGLGYSESGFRVVRVLPQLP